MDNEQKGYFSLKEISPVIRFLTISDFLLIGGWGLMSPIFAIFIVDSIKGGSIEVVGVATAVYLITKSLAQIPMGFFIDKVRGERDDYRWLIIGSLLFSVVPLLYLIVDTPLGLYIVQFFYGIAAAMTFPSWYAIFTRHMDKNKEGIEWGIYNTLVDLSAAGAAAIGGLIAAAFGFVALFVIVSIFSFIGASFLFMVAKNMKK